MFLRNIQFSFSFFKANTPVITVQKRNLARRREREKRIDGILHYVFSHGDALAILDRNPMCYTCEKKFVDSEIRIQAKGILWNKDTSKDPRFRMFSFCPTFACIPPKDKSIQPDQYKLATLPPFEDKIGISSIIKLNMLDNETLKKEMNELTDEFKHFKVDVVNDENWYVDERLYYLPGEEEPESERAKKKLEERIAEANKIIEEKEAQAQESEWLYGRKNRRNRLLNKEKNKDKEAETATEESSSNNKDSNGNANETEKNKDSSITENKDGDNDNKNKVNNNDKDDNKEIDNDNNKNQEETNKEAKEQKKDN